MAGPVRLAHSVFGESASIAHGRTPVLVLHGLLGSGRNWRTLAEKMATGMQRLIYTLDARNHGDSPHIPDMSYESMSSDVTHFCQSHDLNNIILMGHSMGGKTAMVTALRHSEIIDKLIILDVSPHMAPATDETKQLLQAVRSLDTSSLRYRREADAFLKKKVQDSVVRNFLLTNVTPDPISGTLKWRPNLDAIDEFITSLKEAIPLTDSNQTFDGSTLFIGGEKSNYILPEYVPEIKRLFKNADVKFIPGAGHWLHFEKPTEFIKLVTEFVNAATD